MSLNTQVLIGFETFALLNLAIDSKYRGRDLTLLRTGDVTDNLMQLKSRQPVQFEFIAGNYLYPNRL